MNHDYQLDRVIEALERTADELDPLLVDKAKAEAEFKRVFFLAYTASKAQKKSDKTCEAEAHVVAQEQFVTWKVLEARVRAKESLLRSLDSQGDDLRTRIASTRQAR